MNHLRHEGLGTAFSTLAALASPLHDQIVHRPLYPAVPRLEIRSWVWWTLKRAARTLGTWRQRQHQRCRLAELDDHLLRDIGITRAQARAEFDKPFWRA